MVIVQRFINLTCKLYWKFKETISIQISSQICKMLYYDCRLQLYKKGILHILNIYSSY